MSSRSPRPATSLRLAATGGRADLMRIVLTALGGAATTVGLLLAMSVAAIGSGDGPYTADVLNQPGLRPGVIVVLLLLCVPVLFFVGQCTRVGAPQRDRRLAALRMAGATPADVRRIAAMETGLAGVIGAVLGATTFFAGRALLGSPQVREVEISTDEIGSDGQVTRMVETLSTAAHTLPTDVTLPAWSIVLALLAVPLAATAASVVALRQVTISPFGVIHHRVTRPPTLLPIVLLLAGAGGLAIWETVATTLRLDLQDGLGLYAGVALVLFVLAAVGLIFGSASVAFLIGTWLAPRVRHPSLLIAARRMIDAPFTASRASSAVLLAVLLGAAVQGTRATFLLLTDPSDGFYADTFRLLDTALLVAIGVAVAGLLVITAEGIVARRRTLASLTAAGTPRRVLAAATLIEVFLPLVPTVVLATAAGVLAARGFFGTTVQPPGSGRVPGRDVTAAVGVPVPWVQLSVLAGGTLAAVVLVTTLALIFLRRSTSVTELRTAA